MSSSSRTKHCKSSGYESFGLEESERDSSIESPTVAAKAVVEANGETASTATYLTLSGTLSRLQPMPILQYREGWTKLDGRKYFGGSQVLLPTPSYFGSVISYVLRCCFRPFQIA